MQNNFTTLKISQALPVHPCLPTIPLATNYLSSCLPTFVLSRISHSWNHSVCSLSDWLLSLSILSFRFSSVAQSCPNICDPMDCNTPGFPVHHQFPELAQCPCPLSQWYHPTISSSIIPFSSCLQSFPASGSFPMSQFFPSGDQSAGVSASASVLPMNIQDWFP